MSWPLAKASVTVPLRAARLPPLAVTSYVVPLPVTASVAVVPVTEKSPVPTFDTASSNVTRQVRLSSLVGEVEGVWRSIEVTRGAVVSGAVVSVFAVPVTLMRKLELSVAQGLVPIFWWRRSWMLHPLALPESSPSEVVNPTPMLPEVPSTTTKYLFSFSRVKPDDGAVNVFRLLFAGRLVLVSASPLLTGLPELSAS